MIVVLSVNHFKFVKPYKTLLKSINVFFKATSLMKKKAFFAVILVVCLFTNFMLFTNNDFLLDLFNS